MAARSLCMIIMVVIVFHFGLAGEPVRSFAATATGYSSSATDATSLPRSLLPDSTCRTCGSVTVVCSKPTSPADHWIPWVSSGCSILLFIVPAIRRIWKMIPGRLGVRNAFFSWSLILGFAQCMLWAFYFSACESGHSTHPIWVSSVAGVGIHLILFFLTVLKDNNITAGLFRTRSMLYVCVFAIVFGTSNSTAVTGWLGLLLGLLSHCFRMTSTDYSKFSWELCFYSAFGSAAGFIWLYHPNISVATEYKVTSCILGVLRGVDVYQWISPKIAAGLRKMEGHTVSMD